MDSKNTKSFFHLSDGMMTEHANLDAFTISLILNIMFYDKVVIDRAYLFSSLNIQNYLITSDQRNKGASILEYFTEEGVINLALKKNEDADPELLVKELSNQFKEIEGMNIETYKQMDEYFKYVQKGVKNGVILHSPNDPKENKIDYGYFDLMDGLFRLEEDEITKYLKNPSERNWFLEKWERAKIWRTKCLHYASERTIAKKFGIALQRSEFFRAIGSEDIFKDKNVSKELYANVEEQKKHLAKEDEDALDIIVTAANQLHHMELSKKYDCTIDYPVVNIISPLLINKYFEDSSEPGSPRTKGIPFTLEFPSIERLILIDPSALSDVRRKYLTKIQSRIHTYRNQRTQEVLESLRILLKNYCKEVRDVAKSTSSPLKVYLEPIADRMAESGISGLSDFLMGYFDKKGILMKFILDNIIAIAIEIPRKQLNSRMELKTSYTKELNFPVSDDQ